jgi:hypothetical protein
MPSGGVKRGLERPAMLAIGRGRRSTIRIELVSMVQSRIAGLQHQGRPDVPLSDLLSGSDLHTLSECLAKVDPRLWDLQ